jgi:alkylhydroperoxidase family enzyme
MSLLKTVAPENAEGVIKEYYSLFLEKRGIIPKPFEMLSVNPELFKIQAAILTYYMKHPTLSFPLLTHIRYAVAKEYDFQYCTSFNKDLLKLKGLDEEELAKIEAESGQSLLEEKDNAILSFVLKAIKHPATVGQQDINVLHNLGWTDKDIADAMYHGVQMVNLSILMKAFKMDNC